MSREHPERADLLLATGGTGGHIYPALAVAGEARERGMTVAFIGQAGGMESRLVPAAGYPFRGVAAGKWDRQRPDPRQALAALRGPVEAVRYVRRLRPRGVLGFGGFASFPGCMAALLTGVPLALHEGNAFPSRVNRWFAGRATLVVSAFEQARARLGTHGTFTVLPFPVRETRVPKDAARRAFGIPEDALVTLVMGGSQGSLTLNRTVPAALERLGDARPPGLHVLHSSGPAWLEELAARVATRPEYHPFAYLEASAAWSAADLAITRAGIGTLSEAAFHGVPLVMVPLPTAAEGHQRFNALAVQEAGAGLLVDEGDVEARLPEAWGTLLQPGPRAAAAAAARARSPEGAASAIVDALEAHLLRPAPAIPSPNQGETA